MSFEHFWTWSKALSPFHGALQLLVVELNAVQLLFQEPLRAHGVTSSESYVLLYGMIAGIHTWPSL